MTAGVSPGRPAGSEALADRALRRLARHDPRGRWRRVLLAAVAAQKILTGELRTAGFWLRMSLASPYSQHKLTGRSSVPVTRPSPIRPQYLKSVAKLAQYSFPAWDDSICVVGFGVNDVVGALERAGYTHVAGIELAEQETVAALRSCDSTYRTVIVLDLVEQLDPSELDSVLVQLHRITSEFVVASIPTYPEALFPIADVREPPRVLETRDWWDRTFTRRGFEPCRAPMEDLLPLSPALYRTAGSQLGLPQSDPHTAPESAPSHNSADLPHPQTEQRQQTRALFVLPPQENAFLWVVRELVDQLQALSFPARMDDSGRAEREPYGGGTTRVTWAHFWPAYRRLAQQVEPEFEVFVSNFYLERQGELSGWLAEMCERPSLKLPPSHFAKGVLLRLGVPDEKIVVLPHGYSPEFAATPEPLPLPTRKSFRFLAVVNSYDPYLYGLDLLMQPYRQAFGPGDDVCLVVKDYGRTSELTRSLLGGADGPEVLYYANFLPKPELASFYAAHSALVAPYRGEGFGMKILDAAAIGLPLVMPHFGGPIDYCLEKWIEPVSYQLVPVGRCLETEAFDWREDLTWCEPDVGDLAARMRRVYENPEEPRERAAQLRQHVLDNFSWRSAAQTLIRALQEQGAAR